MALTEKDLHNIFTYHAPIGDQAERYIVLRAMARDFALLINTTCPDSREKSLAITNLQQAMMWANASIAINEPGPDWTPVTEGAEAINRAMARMQEKK